MFKKTLSLLVIILLGSVSSLWGASPFDRSNVNDTTQNASTAAPAGPLRIVTFLLLMLVATVLLILGPIRNMVTSLHIH